MNDAEFDRFFDHFAGVFPNKAAWVEGHGPDYLRTWADVLRQTDLVDARSAVSQLVRGVVELPAAWELIPAEIARVAERCKIARITEQYHGPPSNDELSGDCQLCNGGGLVLCWDNRLCRGIATDREVVKRTRVRVGDRWRPIQCGVPCKCSQGDRFATRYKNLGQGKLEAELRIRYDAHRFCRVESDDLETDIREWLANRVTEPPANYSQELAAFNSDIDF